MRAVTEMQMMKDVSFMLTYRSVFPSSTSTTTILATLHFPYSSMSMPRHSNQMQTVNTTNAHAFLVNITALE